MKKRIISLISLSLFAVSFARGADKVENPNQRFYGKITAINAAQKNFTVHNGKRDADETFQWDDKTGVTANKKSIAPAELKVGQFLMVSYVTENDRNKAEKISVRTPFKKSADQ